MEHFFAIDISYRYNLNCIVVKPGARLSRQLHHHGAKHWVAVRGAGQVDNGGHSYLVMENEFTYIPIGPEHCLENPGKITLELIELQSGSYLREDDIVRIEGPHGRY